MLAPAVHYDLLPHWARLGPKLQMTADGLPAKGIALEEAPALGVQTATRLTAAAEAAPVQARQTSGCWVACRPKIGFYR